MRRSPRAALTWLVAALVALGTARVVATDLATLHHRANDADARTVVIARHDLALGSEVRADDVTMGELVAPGTPRHALARTSDAVGRIVAVPVLAGGVLVEGSLASRGRDGLDGLVPPGRRAMRIVPEDGLRPEPGQVVDVLASLDPSLVVDAGGGEPTITVASAVRVLAVDGVEPADGIGGADVRVGVTLLVSQAEAHRLAFAAANGILVLAVAPPEDACCNPSSSASSKG